VIWEACKGKNHIGHLSGTLYRLVESQEQVATMGYVDTLDEQAVLEELLESVKPPYPDGLKDYHYLLTTPFRYPPLHWGSRFGQTNEPSLFYGGCNPSTTLAESAYYRFVFLYSMEIQTSTEKMRSEHTMFSVRYQTNNGVKLHLKPFADYLAELTDPQDYSHTQHVGSSMRNADVDAFLYVSSRDRQHGLCIGMFNSSPFKDLEPRTMTQWLCETSEKDVMFKQIGENNVVKYSVDDFLIAGKLPLPA
tara:strand:+ start:12841 stop:13587 length:747 start_codon:yes stop_codon:yes gene_type:complete